MIKAFIWTALKITLGIPHNMHIWHLKRYEFEQKVPLFDFAVLLARDPKCGQRGKW